MVFLDEISESDVLKLINDYLKVDLEIAKSRQNFIIVKSIQQYLKDIFGNQNLHSIILSEETIAEHSTKHPKISANDYYFVLKSLDKEPLANFGSGKNNQLFFYNSTTNTLYRTAIKATKNNEIFIKSVVKGENVKKELRNKQRASQEP